MSGTASLALAHPAPALLRPELTLLGPLPATSGAASPSAIRPPHDEDVYSYLGPQRRWVQILMTVSFLLAGVSLTRFSTNAWFLTPLLLVLVLNLSASVVSAFSGWNKRRFRAFDHDELIRNWIAATTDFPTVDVFLPTCGEPIEVLRNTYQNVADMQWGNELTVWVLDDADRVEVAQAAEDFGFRYVVRPDRGHMKKAGNLRHAFGLSSADYIAIFDADFCPRTDYLLHLAPYFQDAGVGIVQSPQCFTTTRSMTWLERTAGATQELFYRWVQPSRDAAGGAICVGTCALYRRSALEEAGGFAQIEHSEDVHTGIALLQVGFVTRYVPVVISRGLCPDNLAGFLNQQYRWCSGSISLMRSGATNTPALSRRQRVCFWAGFLYYISTAVNVFMVHVPGIIMAVFFADQVRSYHFVPFLLGMWVYLALLPRVSTTRWRFEVLRVQMAYSFAHALSLTHMLGGRTKGWVPTGAVGKSNSLATTISRIGSVTIAATLTISWTAAIYDVVHFGLGPFWLMLLFLLAYTYVSLPLLADFLRVLGVLRPGPVRTVSRSAEPVERQRLSLVGFLAVTAIISAVALAAGGQLGSLQ